MAKQIDYEIVEEYGVISESYGGWTKELNMVRWSDNQPKYDIRGWSPDHSKSSRGVTLTQEEAEALYDILGEALRITQRRDRLGGD